MTLFHGFYYAAIVAAISVVASSRNLNSQEVPNNGTQTFGEIGIFSARDEVLDFMIYAEPSVKNQTEAQEVCKQILNAALSIMSPTLFNEIKMLNFPPPGKYWINGKAGSEYVPEASCDKLKAEFQITDELKIVKATRVEYCLILNKGNTLDTTYLQEVPCSSKYGVMCAYLKDGSCS